jgi:hypothetical protein
MGFKGKYFKCFSCGAGGSVIDLTEKLFSLTAIEAVQKLNIDFSLGLDLKSDYVVDSEEIRRIEQNRNLIKGFKKWVDETYSNYASLARLYVDNIKKYQPVIGDEEFHPKYVEAVHRLPAVNYILDVLFEGSDQDKILLYKELTIREVTAANE